MQFHPCTEYRRFLNEEAIAKIRSAQSHHYWGQWISDPMALLNLILSFGKKDDLVADESETDDVDELTQTLKRVKNGGEYFGEFSFTVVLFARAQPRQVANHRRRRCQDLRRSRGRADSRELQRPERLSVDCSGQGQHSTPPRLALSGNYADVSLVYAPSARR